MVLGFGGFLGLSTSDYKNYLENKPTSELKEQEVAKLRRQIASVWQVGGGIGGAAFTCGGTLLISGIAARKWRVSDRKLKMIQEELIRRDVALHGMTWRDLLIPLGASLVGLGVGVGVSDAVGSLVELGTTTTGGTAGSVSDQHTKIIAEVHSPGSAAKGFDEGFIGQGKAIEAGIDALQSGQKLDTTGGTIFIVGTNEAAQLTTDQLAHAGGAELGSAAALALEKSIGATTAQLVTWSILEQFENPDWQAAASKHLGCSRFTGLRPGALGCDACQKEISCGTYLR